MRRLESRQRGAPTSILLLPLLLATVVAGCEDAPTAAGEIGPVDIGAREEPPQDLTTSDAPAGRDETSAAETGEDVDATDQTSQDVPSDGPGDVAPDDASPEPQTDVESSDLDASPREVRRIVVAGDSWSTGAALPLIAALPEWGYPDVEVTWETTALAGSQAWEWVTNQDGKLDALDAALDAEPPAELMLLFIGGNDFNFEMITNGWSQRRRDDTIDEVEDDIQALVSHALNGRPHLHVALVDYSYFNYPKMRVTYGFDFAPNLADLNEAYVEMGRRKLAIATGTARCHYAHNFGIQQHTLGDEQRVYPVEPWIVPAYEPGFFPAPGHAPDYDPYPGGNTAFPGPDPALFDGLHLTDDAMRILLDNVLDQGMGNLLDGRSWTGQPQ